jgi:spore coat-associated protein N
MQRAAVLWRASPGRLVAALFALMLAAAMAVGSGANFNATSANPGNMVTAGILDHSNDKDGTAIFDLQGLVPGTAKSGTVTLQNTGDVNGNFTLSASNITASGSGADMRNQLVLTVKDGAATVYTGTIGGLQTNPQNLGTWAPGASHTFTFSVLLPDTGTGGSDNQYQGSKVGADFNWESTS